MTNDKFDVYEATSRNIRTRSSQKKPRVPSAKKVTESETNQESKQKFGKTSTEFS